MGWFDEQIRQRKQYDQESFEDAVLDMASAVLGKQGAGKLNDDALLTRAAIDRVLHYYHCKPVDIPGDILDTEEQLEYALRPHGILHRHVNLSGDWYRDAFGPMLVRSRKDGIPMVLLPRTLQGYYWIDSSGRRHTVGRKNRELFHPEAVCFYAPLPQGKIGIPDLLSYMKQCMRLSDVMVLFGLTFLVVLTGMMLPRITRLLTGFILESGNGNMLWSTAVFLLSVLIASQLFSASRELAMNRLKIKIALSVEAAMMMRLMSLPASFFKKFSSGELASRCGAINELCLLLLDDVVSLGITAAVSLLYVGQIFNYTPSLGIPAVIVLLLIMCTGILTLRIQTRVAGKQMHSAARESGMTYALISGIQKIRLSGAEKRAFARWARAYAESVESTYNPPLFLKLHKVIVLAVSLGGTAAMYYIAASTAVIPSEYLAFNAAFGAVTGAFYAYTDTAVSTARIRPILEMAEPILQENPEASDAKEMVDRVSGNIELSGVSFRYDERMPYVIDNMNLKIRAGEYLAVVGTTGCGKSTLIRLLLGFETPEKGTIYYDNKDLRNLDLRSLRRRLGVVTQDGELFQGDIFSNITVSAPWLSEKDAWEAAELAGIGADIRAMPMGMRTIIGEGQGGLSGGQKQRLMIARAIAPKPSILLFDEATSALDNLTQKQVAEALETLGCTRIVVAHRLSTIRNCDRILVMDQGRIVEQGTYEELLAADGLFRRLTERQRLDIK